jgi:outer membrane autotransporter protein
MSRQAHSVVSCVRWHDREEDAPRNRHGKVAIVFAMLGLLACGAPVDRAIAQTCTVAGNSTVTLTSGICSITPGTTLNGTPAVHSSSGAAVTTNNVNINPFNGGSIGGLADTTGTITFSAGSSINGNWTIAAEALSGGQIIFQAGSAINPPFGGGATALLADGTNSQISATGLAVGLNGAGNNVAARATGGATINLVSGNSITYAVGGGGNTGLWASGIGSQIFSAGTTLSMPGGGGNDVGARADTGGTVTLNQGSVTVNGNGGSEMGLLAQSAGSTIVATGVAITAGGSGGDVGAKALGGGAITLNGGSVSAPGGNGGEIGLQSSGAGSTITGTGVTVTVPNSSAGRGAEAISAGTIVLDGGSVSTGAGSAAGLLATGANSSITTTDVDVTTLGSTAHAGAVTGGGALAMTGGTLTANGAGSNALNVSGGTATLAGVVMTSPNGTSIAAIGGNSNVILSGGTMAIVNSGQWLNVTGGSTLDLTMDASTVRGAALTDAGSTSSVTMRNGSLWTMTGNSNLTNLTNASSLIQFTPPTGDPTLLSSYKTLTAVNYVGASGTLGLNTFLGSDGSPSDRLVINGGTASGNSFLHIANTTGAGALTTGNGILVVDAINGATTVPGAFALSAPAVAGPYEYTLFRSSLDPSNPQAWYLRSTLNCDLVPTLPACQKPVPPEPPVPPVPPQPPTPNYREETSLYAAIPAMALLYGSTLLDTLHERVGEEGTDRFAANSGSGNLGWGRVIGANGVQHGDTSGVLSGSTGGPAFSYTFTGLQAGMDVYRQDRPDGSRDQAGGYFAIGADRGTVTHFDGRQGDSDFNAYSLGGYWTHFGAGGWYTDAILQGTFYDMVSTGNRGLPALQTAGQGAAASIEAGYPFKFAGGYFIEPQAQLVYQHVNINNASDIAAQIRFSDVDSLLGRIGARFGRTWTIDDSQRTVTAWVRPNLWNEFLGNPVTSFSSETGFIPFHADLGGLWGEVNLGVSGQIAANASLYANASYRSRFDGGGFAYTGKAGLRVDW